jgi:mRNA-degrading endonuclease RelE of RelBE toxin-antitoxin system
VASARRYLLDQHGLRAVGAAIAALAGDPYPEPPAGFHRGRYHRLRVGAYRVMYVVDEAVITIERVDRLTTLLGVGQAPTAQRARGRVTTRGA